MILGFVAVFFAIGVATPSTLELIRIPSFLAAVFGLVKLWRVIRGLLEARELRLKFLRKWQMEIFTTGDSVDSLSKSQFESLIRLVDFLEDSTKAKESFYETLDKEFMRAIKGTGA